MPPGAGIKPAETLPPFDTTYGRGAVSIDTWDPMTWLVAPDTGSLEALVLSVGRSAPAEISIEAWEPMASVVAPETGAIEALVLFRSGPGGKYSIEVLILFCKSICCWSSQWLSIVKNKF